tara:strand:- start:189 stop:566 length:378 start_codon:yes stop_codon:yes gene_type:complete
MNSSFQQQLPFMPTEIWDLIYGIKDAQEQHDAQIHADFLRQAQENHEVIANYHGYRDEPVGSVEGYLSEIDGVIFGVDTSVECAMIDRYGDEDEEKYQECEEEEEKTEHIFMELFIKRFLKPIPN